MVEKLPWLKGVRAHPFEGSIRGAQRRQTHEVRREAVRSEATNPSLSRWADFRKARHTERWLSGRKRSPAKGVRANTPSRVRIPLSPPHFLKSGRWLPQPDNAPVAQLDRVLGYEPSGREFESLRARQKRQRAPLWGPLSLSAPDNIRTPEFDPRLPQAADRPKANLSGAAFGHPWPSRHSCILHIARPIFRVRSANRRSRLTVLRCPHCRRTLDLHRTHPVHL